jgi:hypothetical protein
VVGRLYVEGSAISGSTRWVLGLLAVVAALAVAAVVLSLEERAPAELAEGSPEAVVQRYLGAVRDDDLNALVATLGPWRAAECQVGELRRALEPAEARDFSGVLQGVERYGAEARVSVRITEYADRRSGEYAGGALLGAPEGPPGGGIDEFTEQFVLARDAADDWRIVEPSWPYLPCLEQ